MEVIDATAAGDVLEAEPFTYDWRPLLGALDQAACDLEAADVVTAFVNATRGQDPFMAFHFSELKRALDALPPTRRPLFRPTREGAARCLDRGLDELVARYRVCKTQEERETAQCAFQSAGVVLEVLLGLSSYE